MNKAAEDIIAELDFLRFFYHEAYYAPSGEQARRLVTCQYKSATGKPVPEKFKLED